MMTVRNSDIKMRYKKRNADSGETLSTIKDSIVLFYF